MGFYPTGLFGGKPKADELNASIGVAKGMAEAILLSFGCF
jgi:hypothetical protein